MVQLLFKLNLVQLTVTVAVGEVDRGTQDKPYYESVPCHRFHCRHEESIQAHTDNWQKRH